MPKIIKKCETCNESHNNRKVNKCNDCRDDICLRCNTVRNLKWSKCYFCERFFEVEESRLKQQQQLQLQ